LTLCMILSSSCIQANNYPVITSVQSQKDWVTASGSTEVECVASDPDSDSLTYEWLATSGSFSSDGPIATWTAPKMPGNYTLTVNVIDDRGGEAKGQTSIEVIDNRPPVIESLTAEPPVIDGTKTTTIKCVASDSDGDSLAYDWSTMSGSFSGEGSVTTWIAPKIPGNYTVTAKVTDGSGGKATKELNIEVRANRPPVIESLTANPPAVNQGQTTTLKCIASDPDGDELSYLWVVPRGSISGQGSTVTWTTPLICTTYTIKVTIDDGKDGQASEELNIRVRKPG
ncbi:Ig-like domain-containing protein, partial [Chloroflexota bacterium]